MTTMTKSFTIAIVAMLSVGITMNTVMLYSIGLSLRNQETSLTNQMEMLSNQDEVLDEQDHILLQLINKTDNTD